MTMKTDDEEVIERVHWTGLQSPDCGGCGEERGDRDGEASHTHKDFHLSTSAWTD